MNGELATVRVFANPALIKLISSFESVEVFASVSRALRQAAYLHAYHRVSTLLEVDGNEAVTSCLRRFVRKFADGEGGDQKVSSTSTEVEEEDEEAATRLMDVFGCGSSDGFSEYEGRPRLDFDIRKFVARMADVREQLVVDGGFDLRWNYSEESIKFLAMLRNSPVTWYRASNCLLFDDDANFRFTKEAYLGNFWDGEYLKNMISVERFPMLEILTLSEFSSTAPLPIHLLTRLRKLTIRLGDWKPEKEVGVGATESPRIFGRLEELELSEIEKTECWSEIFETSEFPMVRKMKVKSIPLSKIFSYLNKFPIIETVEVEIPFDPMEVHSLNLNLLPKFPTIRNFRLDVYGYGNAPGFNESGSRVIDPNKLGLSNFSVFFVPPSPGLIHFAISGPINSWTDQWNLAYGVNGEASNSVRPKSIDLSGCHLSEFPTALISERLDALNLSNQTRLRDLGPMGTLTRARGSLQVLRIGNCEKIDQFLAIAELENLQVLDVSGTKFSDVSLLLKMRNLKFLDLAKSKTSSITGLDKHNPEILELNISSTKVKSIRPLLHLCKLRELAVFAVALKTGNVDLDKLRGVRILNKEDRHYRSPRTSFFDTLPKW